MPKIFVDTNVIIRLLTGDDPQKMQASKELFKRVQAGKLILSAPDTVIADAVFVLSSPRLYNKSRGEINYLLSPILQLSGFKVSHRLILLRALAIYAERNIDFGDSMLVSAMEQAGATDLYSYDVDFDRIQSINRLEPK